MALSESEKGLIFNQLAQLIHNDTIRQASIEAGLGRINNLELGDFRQWLKDVQFVTVS